MDIHKTSMQESAVGIDEGLRTHMNKVYGTMSMGLLVTFATAWIVAGNGSLNAVFYSPETGAPTIPGFIVIFAPLAMIFLFHGMIKKASANTVRGFFYLFSGMLGISMSAIFSIYANTSIAQVFLLTSAAFASLSLWGYTTGRDLTGMGAFLIMGLVGLIGAMIFNIFIGSEAMNFAISIIGVGIFAGLTAYDTQRIKSDYLAHRSSFDNAWLDKAATMGAMSLYLDFINMFQMLLSLIGVSRD